VTNSSGFYEAEYHSSKKIVSACEMWWYIFLVKKVYASVF
jgi:hypothetical protein